ncbi:hypothetical protein [Nonomuraea typhae]|uniref:hypothetical protein n=1 Tax=Nonomuraea typhae TaxID=2603600 RepID=UPI0012FA83D5|nr:hypothetical protein [Nonomuraea typhae]
MAAERLARDLVAEGFAGQPQGTVLEWSGYGTAVRAAIAAELTSSGRTEELTELAYFVYQRWRAEYILQIVNSGKFSDLRMYLVNAGRDVREGVTAYLEAAGDDKTLRWFAIDGDLHPRRWMARLSRLRGSTSLIQDDAELALHIDHEILRHLRSLPERKKDFLMDLQTYAHRKTDEPIQRQAVEILRGLDDEDRKWFAIERESLMRLKLVNHAEAHNDANLLRFLTNEWQSWLLRNALAERFIEWIRSGDPRSVIHLLEFFYEADGELYRNYGVTPQRMRRPDKSALCQRPSLLRRSAHRPVAETQPTRPGLRGQATEVTGRPGHRSHRTRTHFRGHQRHI